MENQLNTMHGEIEEASKNPQGLIMEALHSVGYAGALSNSLIATESTLMGLDGSVLKDFVAVRLVLSVLCQFFWLKLE
jgi:mitochondrial-processing peptidase subunit alpha